MNISDFLKNGKYLPKPLKDFHNQKTVFKCVDEIAQRYAEKHRTTVPSWIDAQCYVIDIFLWFMAKHGYTLQKTRQRIDDTQNLEEAIEAFETRQEEIFQRILRAQND